MRLHFVAPFRCHFNLVNRQALADEVDYGTFWERLEARATDWLARRPLPLTAEFLHTRFARPAMRYQTLHEDGSLLSPEVMRIMLTRERLDPLMAQAVAGAEGTLSLAALRGTLRPDPGTLVFRVFNNCMGLAELFVDGDATAFANDPDRVSLEVQGWSNRLMAELIGPAYREAIFPLLIALWQLSVREDFLERPGAYAAYPDVTLKEPIKAHADHLPDYDADAVGVPLWTNRSIYLLGTEPALRDVIAAAWVPAGRSAGEPIFLGWGHNLFNAPEDAPLARDARQALVLAQYFYTALDRANQHLTRYVGQSLGRLSRREVKTMSATLQEAVSALNLLVTQFTDTLQNLQGHRQAFLKELKDRWNMDGLVQNVEKKVGMVQGQLTRLNERSLKISQAIVQLILFAIGGIALFDFCVNLSWYSHTAVESADTGPAPDGVWGLLDISSWLPPDAVLWAGVSFF